jgi:hypothetical protein
VIDVAPGRTARRHRPERDPPGHPGGRRARRSLDLEEQCRTAGCSLSDEQKREYMDAAIGLALSAPGTTHDIMLRYGIHDRIDAGIRWSTTGAHADAKYQFLDLAGWAGSISVGYRHQLFGAIPSLGIMLRL